MPSPQPFEADFASGEQAPRTPWLKHYPAELPANAHYPDIPLWGFLEDRAKRMPDRIALDHAGGALSFAALWSLVLKEAEHFARVGMATDEQFATPAPRFLMQLPNGLAFVALYEAALRAGFMVSTASPALSAQELQAQWADVDPVVVALAEEKAERLAPAFPDHVGLIAVAADQSSWRWLRVPKSVDQAAPVELPKRDQSWGSHVAVLQYTSGTTGGAKGAMMTHRNLVANALQNTRWFGWTPDDVILGVLPLCHTWGMCVCLNSGLAIGAKLVLPKLPEHFDPVAVVDALEASRASVLYGSGTMMHRLLEVLRKRPDAARSLKHCKAGAMLTQGALKQHWDGALPHAPLQQGYGLTEASPESHNNPPKRFKQGTVGVPIQDTLCKIVDPANPEREMPVGESGEVLLKGPQITKGYWRKPQASADAFFEGWLRTGDLGAMDHEGYLTILDRLKDLLKFRGYSVLPGTIEDCLLKHPAIQQAVVVGRDDERDGERPIACIVLRAEADVRHDDPKLFDALKQYCSEHLAPYEIPREWRVMNDIPKNHVAKPLRRVLREWVNARADLPQGFHLL